MGNPTWHPPFSGALYHLLTRLSMYTIYACQMLPFMVYLDTVRIIQCKKSSITVDVDIWFGCLRFFSLWAMEETRV